jgi:hypothetical protein
MMDNSRAGTAGPALEVEGGISEIGVRATEEPFTKSGGEDEFDDS